MTDLDKAVLRTLAETLDYQEQEYRNQVRRLSGNRPHHQACWIGGLMRGLPANASGSPCWCGIEKE